MATQLDQDLRLLERQYRRAMSEIAQLQTQLSRQVALVEEDVPLTPEGKLWLYKNMTYEEQQFWVMNTRRGEAERRQWVAARLEALRINAASLRQQIGLLTEVDIADRSIVIAEEG